MSDLVLSENRGPARQLVLNRPAKGTAFAALVRRTPSFAGR